MAKNTSNLERVLFLLIAAGLGVLAFAAGAGVVVTLASPMGSGIVQSIEKLFGLTTVQSFWYMTRAAGLVAYLLLWLSTAYGIAVSSKILDPWMNRFFTFDFHQFLSLLAIGFIILHIVVLMFDHYLPYSLAQILVPFISPYRPVWVGVGIIAFYLTILVSITFYMKSRVSPQMFRKIHYFSYLAFFSSALHGFTAGTDSPLITTQLMYIVTTLVVVFLTVFHVLTRISAANEKKAAASRGKSALSSKH